MGNMIKLSQSETFGAKIQFFFMRSDKALKKEHFM
mgnify:CR=1 FL=1